MSEKWRDELLAALSSMETSPNGDGLTTQEIADLKGWTVCVADARVRQMWRHGEIEACRKFIANRAGCRQSVPAYRKKPQ